MSFQPWLGNFNPTDQQKNEYIRLLKAALVDDAGLLIEDGTYVGDGTSSRIISLTDGDLTPSFILLGCPDGVPHLTLTFGNFIPNSLTFRDVSAPFAGTDLITAFSSGSFRVGNTTWSNANTYNYYYTVFGL